MANPDGSSKRQLTPEQQRILDLEKYVYPGSMMI
jgi:hypothetical protein